MPDGTLRSLLDNNHQERAQTNTNAAPSYAEASSMQTDDRSSTDSSGYLQLSGWPSTSEILQSSMNRINSLDNMAEQIAANNLGLLEGVNLIDEMLGEPYAQNLSLPHSSSHWSVLMGGNPLTAATHLNPLINTNVNLMSMLNNGADTTMIGRDFNQFVLGNDQNDDEQQMTDLAIQSSSITSTTNTSSQTYSTPTTLNHTQLVDSLQPNIYNLSSITAVPKTYPNTGEPRSSSAQSVTPTDLTSHYQTSHNNETAGILSQSNGSVFYQASPSTDSQSTLINNAASAGGISTLNTDHRRQNTENVLKSCGLYDATILTGSLVKREKLISTQISDMKRDLQILQQSIQAD